MTDAGLGGGGETARVDEHVYRAPARRVQPFVAWYSGYRQAGAAPASHRGLPSPALTFIVTLDDPLVLAAHPDPRQPPGSYDSLIGGLHTRPALITHDGRQSGIQLALTPLGARALLGMPAGELANVAGLAAESGCSARHLNSLLRAEVGLAPKAAARVIRFDHARRLITRAARSVAAGSGGSAASAVTLAVTLADLAADCGYYDQAHLAREFRDMAGCPPTQWLAEEFRFADSSDSSKP